MISLPRAVTTRSTWDTDAHTIVDMTSRHHDVDDAARQPRQRAFLDHHRVGLKCDGLRIDAAAAGPRRIAAARERRSAE